MWKSESSFFGIFLSSESIELSIEDQAFSLSYVLAPVSRSSLLMGDGGGREWERS
jgi:hypothetical protein